jgi:DNA-directed RNA polymerase specialized sigma24 family protein
VQEAWLRLSRSNSDEIEHLSGWLTTVVAHICVDMLRSCPPTSRSGSLLAIVPMQTPNAE